MPETLPTRQPRRWPTAALGLVAILIPVGVYAARERLTNATPPPLHQPEVPTIPPSRLPFAASVLGRPAGEKPLITNVRIFDLDRDGLPDVLACDARLNRVVWCRQTASGRWEEHTLGDADIPAPCHVEPVDLDGDGDTDLVVACLGSVWPTNDRVGRVVWLENRGGQSFVTHTILDDLRRVADVQAGDLNGDGKIDLVVAEFGFDNGRVLWLENRGGGRFRDRELLTAPGTIHVPLADFDGDGDLDIVALVSQDYEEVWAFENLGGGNFRRRVIAGTPNFDFGSAGLVLADLDRDGRPDLLWVAGDSLEIFYPHSQPWHGCVWLRNTGGWAFEPRRIATFPGTYAAAVADANGDGHPDVVLSSMFNDWRRPGSASVVWLENDGHQNFTPWTVADRPTHQATVAAGDLDGDGRAEIVAGGFHILAPFDRVGRLTLWSPSGGRP